MSTLRPVKSIVEKYSLKKNEVDNHICEVCELPCHECSAKDEVENYNQDSVVENEGS